MTFKEIFQIWVATFGTVVAIGLGMIVIVLISASVFR